MPVIVVGAVGRSGGGTIGRSHGRPHSQAAMVTVGRMIVQWAAGGTVGRKSGPSVIQTIYRTFGQPVMAGRTAERTDKESDGQASGRRIEQDRQ